MADVDVWIPGSARDRLAAAAAGEGLSLRAYLVRLAEELPGPRERDERAEQARAVMERWNGYAPGEDEQERLDAELDRRLRRVVAR